VTPAFALVLLAEVGTATAAAPAARTSTAAPEFIKGELTYVGTRELVSRYDHLGVRIGPRIIGQEIFLGVTPGAAFYPEKWAVGFHVPLNLLMLEAGTNDFGGFKLRRGDWDEVSDYTKIIRFITYGRKEEPLYFTVTSLRPYTLGHGQLIAHYQPSIDIDRSLTGLVFEGTLSWGGVQLEANDITFQSRVFGALAFVKPLFFLDNAIAQSLSLGVEYAGDLRAPRCVQLSEQEPRCVPGSGNQAGFDPLTGQSRDDTFVRTDRDLGRPVVEETDIHSLGFSGEIKLVKTEPADLKVYGTWHQFLDAGDGIAFGLLGRFNLGDDTVHAFRTRVELRSFGARFQPGYFDTLYEVTKYQMVQSEQPFQIAPTKYQWVFGDPENGFPILEERRHWGYDVELSWGMFSGGRSGKQVALALGASESTRDYDTNFYLHLELPIVKFLQLFGSFIRVNASNLGDVFAGSPDNVIVLSGLRVQILPFLFANASYTRAFRILRSPGREFHLGNENIVDESGQPSRFFTNDRIFENVDTLYVDIELGWEFRE
jgi:hypothetical protein